MLKNIPRNFIYWEVVMRQRKAIPTKLIDEDLVNMQSLHGFTGSVNIKGR